MSEIQWLYHFLEINHFLKKELKEETEITTEITRVALDLISEKLDLVAAVAATDPKVGSMIIQRKELARAKEALPENEFTKKFEEMKQLLPKEVNVHFISGTTKNNLPKVSREEFKRKYGIIDQEGDTR